ncbi:MAG: PilN domain-containing protein [Nitrospirota bacterium]|nr:PilN domain-containing protein [Nitrospirota bacterium]MDP2383494.1 PilN domain-containing protein [Nitrospirota bacterium]MDP3597349.1 PilN domain-containing protein [Nitrospirota bacterium]
MASGRKFFRMFAGRVNHVLVKPGGTRYLHIELSSRYRWYLAPTRVVLVALSWILGGAILWSVSLTVMAMHDRQDLQARLDHVRVQDHQLLAEAQREGLDLSVSSLQQLPGEVSLANQLLTKRHFSWTQFLSALETAIPLHVSIQSIRLDPGSAVVHMTGLAVTVEDVTALTVTLQDHAVFRDPVLGQHRVGQDGLVEFDLTLHYRQPGA